MIYMCSGKTGSGKSATAVQIVYSMWKIGRDVWSNTPLFFTDFHNGFGGENIIDNPEYFTIWEKAVEIIRAKIVSKLLKKEYRPLYRGKINYFDTIDETFHIKNAVLLFDEGQTLFRNYDWESIPRLFLYKLEQNRKHGLDLVTTAQRMKAVNINYRELIQVWNHFIRILPEWFTNKFRIHIYWEYLMEEENITDNFMNMTELLKGELRNKETGELLKPKGYRKKRLKILGFWQKRIYDTMYDIGFEPLQHYSVMLGGTKVKLHLESGMTVKQAITMINTYKKLIEI
jgi:hypothetical protein